MKVTIVRGGGVGGMATRTVLDAAALPAADAPALAAQVSAAGLAAGAPAAPAAPDDLLYEITVDDSGQAVTQRYSEQSLPEPVRQLVQWVDNRPERSFGLDR